MKQYTYYTRDYYSNSGTYLMSKDHFYTLMQHSFHYGCYLSLVIHDPDHPVVQELQKWNIQCVPFSLKDLTYPDRRRVYTACDDVFKILQPEFENWRNPSCTVRIPHQEDVAFLRKDGSIFFDSIFHEGEYSIYPQENEPVGEILQYGHWLLIDANGSPSAPAREHQLLPRSREEIELDSLFVLLLNVRDNPHKYLKSPTADELITLIQNYRPPDYSTIPTDLNSRISFLPRWYKGFELFVLAEFDALTNSSIIDVLDKEGYPDQLGFAKFYDLLDGYLTKVCL